MTLDSLRINTYWCAGTNHYTGRKDASARGCAHIGGVQRVSAHSVESISCGARALLPSGCLTWRGASIRERLIPRVSQICHRAGWCRNRRLCCFSRRTARRRRGSTVLSVFAIFLVFGCFVWVFRPGELFVLCWLENS